jgi:hypothetical protein
MTKSASFYVSGWQHKYEENEMDFKTIYVRKPNYVQNLEERNSNILKMVALEFSLAFRSKSDIHH